MADPVTSVYQPISNWGGNTPETNPALADLYNRGWLNIGKSFNMAIPGQYQGVTYNPATSGGAAMPYGSLNDQITDALGMPSRYASGWEWGNGAPRYDAIKSALASGGGMFGAVQLTPQTGGGLPAPGAGAAPPPGASAPPAGGGGMFTPTAFPQGFGPYTAAPAGTPPPTSMTPRAGGAPPQQQDGALAYLIRKGYTPEQAQRRVDFMAHGPQQMGEFNALGNDTARGMFLNTHPGVARELLNSGNMSNAQSTLYSLLAQGYSGR